MLNVRISIRPIDPELPAIGLSLNNMREGLLCDTQWQLPRGLRVRVDGVGE
jgi:hypothetical protein